MDDDDQLRFLKAAVGMEAEMEERARVAEAQLAALHAEGLAAGGHWGRDSEAYADLIDAVAAYRRFAPGWWLPWIGPA